MRRSLNEIERYCQKAAEGAGAPAGLDTESARASAWLAARRFPAFDGLIDALERARDRQACRFTETVAGDTIDAIDKAGAIVAPALVDFLVANAGDAVGRLTVKDLSGALHLLPAAVRYAGDGWHFHFELRGSSATRIQLRVGPEGGEPVVEKADDVSVLAGNTRFDVQAHCARSVDALPDVDSSGCFVSIDETSLAEIEANSLANGVEVDSETWSRLGAFAARILVPASEESRRRGAGSLSSDNE